MLTDDGRQMPGCIISSPMSLQLRWTKNLDTQKIAVTILKFEQCGFTKEGCVQKMQTEWQIVQEQSDLGLQTWLSKNLGSLWYFTYLSIPVHLANS